MDLKQKIAKVTKGLPEIARIGPGRLGFGVRSRFGITHIRK